MLATILMIAMLGQVPEKAQPKERLTGQAVFDRQMDRTYAKMRAEMTPADKAKWKKHYAERRAEVEPLRQGYKRIASGAVVIRAEDRDKLRGLIRQTIAGMEKEVKFYNAPNEHRRYIKTVMTDAKAALKVLEDQSK